MTHPHLEGLISIGENLCLLEVEARNGANAKSIGRLNDDDLAGLKRALGRLADRLSTIQDDVRTLHTALAALPGGGVDGCLREAIAQAEADAEKLYGPKRQQLQRQAKKWRAALPTPNPHEADRNG